MALTVMVPIAEPGIPVTPYGLAIDPARFAGAIGFVANSQPGSVDFLASLAPRVIERLPGGQASFADKGATPAGSAQRLDDAALKRMVGEYGAAAARKAFDSGPWPRMSRCPWPRAGRQRVRCGGARSCPGPALRAPRP
jgi:hypothetical protein